MAANRRDDLRGMSTPALARIVVPFVAAGAAVAGSAALAAAPVRAIGTVLRAAVRLLCPTALLVGPAPH
jgi:hypothetical protein